MRNLFILMKSEAEYNILLGNANIEELLKYVKRKQLLVYDTNSIQVVYSDV